MSVLVRTGPTTTPDTRQVVAELEFTEAPPGMLGLRSFSLTALDDVGYLFAMRSTDEPAIRLFVVAPEPYFPQYAPRLDATTRLALGLADEPAVLLVVVRPGADGEPPTANLLAPVVVNPRTGAALQVVLDGDDWPLRAPFSAAA